MSSLTGALAAKVERGLLLAGLVWASIPSASLRDAVLVAALGVAPAAPWAPLPKAMLVLAAAVVASVVSSVGPGESAGFSGGSAAFDVARVKPAVAAAAKLVPVEEDWGALLNAGVGAVDETNNFSCALGSTGSRAAGGEEPCSRDRSVGAVLGKCAATVAVIATVPAAAGAAEAVAAATGCDDGIVCPALTKLSAGLFIGTVVQKVAQSGREHHVTNTGNVDGLTLQQNDCPKSFYAQKQQ